MNGNNSPRNKDSNGIYNDWSLVVVFLNYFHFFLAIVIKPSNIRIWIHEKDVGKLTQVLWAGQGKLSFFHHFHNYLNQFS
jgi:hypothetical protein